MKKFIIHSLKGKTSIMEVKCEKITGLEDPSIMWAPASEYKSKIIQPESLFEKQNDGSLRAPIYMQWALFDSQELAFEQAKIDLEAGMRRSCAKANCTPPTQDQIKEEISKIQIVLL